MTDTKPDSGTLSRLATDVLGAVLANMPPDVLLRMVANAIEERGAWGTGERVLQYRRTVRLIRAHAGSAPRD